MQPLIIALLLAACTAPAVREERAWTSPNPAPVPGAALTLELPSRLEAWRPGLEADLEAVRAAYLRLTERWPPATAAPPPRLAVLADPWAAAVFWSRRGVAVDDPAVPRTVPRLGVAVVPLPRRDALLAAWPRAPWTLRRSVRHEAVHLWAARRPELRGAPLWFQEGLAEALRDADPAAFSAPEPPAVSPARLADAVAEVRLEGWARWAVHVLTRWPDDPEPWRRATTVEAPSPPEAAAVTIPESPDATGRLPSGARYWGRDVDELGDRRLLAARDGALVQLDLPPLEPGETRRFLLRLGRSGVPDAGLVLPTAEGARIRIRLDLGGGLSAWREEPGAPARLESTDLGSTSGDPGAPREVVLDHRGDAVVVLSGDYHRRFPLSAARPLVVRVWVRGGVLLLESNP